jgi:hypothetical protein
MLRVNPGHEYLNDYSKQTIHTESFSIDHYPAKLLLSNMYMH